jgi:hypothetical protein
MDETNHKRTDISIALEHVLNGFIPVGARQAKVVSQRLIQNWYRAHPKDALRDILSDGALFLYCFRSLLNIESKQKHIENSSPRELLESTDHQALTGLINNASRHVDLLSAAKGSEAQRSTLAVPTIAAAISGALAPGVGADSKTAFSCSLLSQLGMAFIAWNYPHIFSKAVQNKKNSLEHNLLKALGFTPKALALGIAKRWLNSNVMLASLGDKSAKATLNEKEGNIADELTKLCKVGQTLARFHLPWFKSDSEQPYISAVEEVEKALGRKGISTLREKIADECRELISDLPEFLQPDLDTLDTVDDSQLTKEFISQIEALPPDRAFLLVKEEIFSKLSFQYAVIYLLSPDQKLLSPVYSLGLTEIGRFEPIPFLKKTLATSDNISKNILISQALINQNVLISEDNKAGYKSLSKSGVLMASIAPDKERKVEIVKAEITKLAKAIEIALRW